MFLLLFYLSPYIATCLTQLSPVFLSSFQSVVSSYQSHVAEPDDLVPALLGEIGAAHPELVAPLVHRVHQDSLTLVVLQLLVQLIRLLLEVYLSFDFMVCLCASRSVGWSVCLS